MTNNNIHPDKIRIEKNAIHFRMNVVSGKDGAFFIRVSPAFGISGYGKTEKDAEDSFSENIKLFCEDLMSLKSGQREIELSKMGFKKEFVHNKNFSKLYVDNDGILQGLEPESIKSSVLEDSFQSA